MKIYKYMLTVMAVFITAVAFAQKEGCAIDGECPYDGSKKAFNGSKAVREISMKNYDTELSGAKDSLVVLFVAKENCESCDNFKSNYFYKMAEKYTPQKVKFMLITIATTSNGLAEETDKFLNGHRDLFKKLNEAKGNFPVIVSLKNVGGGVSYLNSHSYKKYSTDPKFKSGEEGWKFMAGKVEEDINSKK